MLAEPGDGVRAALQPWLLVVRARPWASLAAAVGVVAALAAVAAVWHAGAPPDTSIETASSGRAASGASPDSSGRGRSTQPGVDPSVAGAQDGRAPAVARADGAHDGDAGPPSPSGGGEQGSHRTRPGGGSGVTSGRDVVAHVAGAVNEPGVHRLPAGARVDDLVAAAGGARADADLDRVNLAATVVDGTRLYIPGVDEDAPPEEVHPSAPVGPASGSPAGPGEGDAPVSINAAGADELEALRGVGPVTAAAIVEHREQHGPFRTVDDLLAVSGIGEVTLEGLREQAVP